MFLYYIKEIRNRSYFLIITWISTIVVSYSYKEKILFLCLKPNLQYFKTDSFYFIFTDLTEIFTTYLELCYFVTNQFFLIKLIYHLIIFISPGLYKFEYKKLINLVLLNFFFFGIFFLILNNILLPLCWNFFLSFKDTTMYSVNFFFEAKINEFVNFYLKFYKFCLLCSSVFVFIYVGLEFLKINNNIFIKLRKNLYFGFLILATMLTPPDIISQLFFFLIFIFIFEFLLILKFSQNLLSKVTN